MTDISERLVVHCPEHEAARRLAASLPSIETRTVR